MDNRYIIQWKSKVNGRVGRGSKFLTRQEADELVAELNSEYPEIEHEVLNVPPEPAAAEAVNSGSEAPALSEASAEKQTPVFDEESENDQEVTTQDQNGSTRALSA